MLSLKRRSGNLSVWGLNLELDRDDEHIIRKTRAHIKMSSKPEDVVFLCEKYPELKQVVDFEYYSRWAKALKVAKRPRKYKIEYKMKPFPHQEQAISFALSLPACALFMEPGTGKTFVALKVAETRIQLGKSKKVLVIAPASILYTGWLEDMSKFTDLRGVVASNKPMRWRGTTSYRKAHKKWGDEAPEDLKLKDKSIEEILQLEDRDVFLTNFQTLYRNVEVFESAGFDTVIVDESTMMKNPSGEFFKSAMCVGDNATYRMILTGTPYTNSYMDLWSQMKFVDGSLDMTIGEFTARFFTQNSKHAWLYHLKRGASQQILSEISDRCLFIPKSVLGDLPDREVRVMSVETSGKLKKHYDEMLEDLLTVLDNEHEVEARNVMVGALRLHQIMQGHVDGQEIEKPKKLSALKEIVDQSPDKVVVWAKYKQDFRWIKELFPGCCVINGDTTDAGEQSKKFLDPKGPKVMLAHPQSAKFGHTWNCAKTSVFYSYDFNLESYLQARDRNYRIGQKSDVVEYVLSCGGIEDRIIEALRGKKEVSDNMLRDLLRKSEI